MALTSGKSEDDLKSLKMAESDNIKNVPSPILRGKEGLQVRIKFSYSSSFLGQPNN